MPRAKTPEIPHNLPWPGSASPPPTSTDETSDLLRQAQAALARPVVLGISRSAKAAAAAALAFLLLALGLAFYKHHLDRPHILEWFFPETLGEGELLTGWIYFSDRNGDVDHLCMEPLRGRFTGFAWTGPRWSSETQGIVVFKVGLEHAEQGQASFRITLVDRKGHTAHLDIHCASP